MSLEQNKAIVLSLEKGDRKTIEEIHRSTYPKIKGMVRYLKGTEEDVKDVFQEGMLKILSKAKKRELEINSSFDNYFITTCKNIWLEELNRRNKLKDNSSGYINSIIDNHHIEKIINSEKHINLFQKHLRKLKEECQKVLGLYFVKTRMAKIMELMGYKSIYFTKIKKQRCVKYLVDRITKDPEFKILENEA